MEYKLVYQCTKTEISPAAFCDFSAGHKINNSINQKKQFTIMANNQFEKINALRASVKDVNAAACTFNQAVKALSGLETKYAEVAEKLGVESFGFKAVCGAWAEALHVSDEGKSKMALYMSETAKVTVAGSNGEPKEVNAYEKTMNKKGVVSFKAIKLRTLTTPSAWSAAIIVEGLVQSTELEEAIEEAKVAQEHFDALVESGEVYVKVAEKGADGSSSIRYELA